MTAKELLQGMHNRISTYGWTKDKYSVKGPGKGPGAVCISGALYCVLTGRENPYDAFRHHAVELNTFTLHPEARIGAQAYLMLARGVMNLSQFVTQVPYINDHMIRNEERALAWIAEAIRLAEIDELEAIKTEEPATAKEAVLV